MKNLLLAAGFCACTGTAALAQTMPGSALVYLDTDDNLQVTQDEFFRQLLQLYAPMDADGNGQLEFAEVEGFMSKEIFDAADTNRNGKISIKEYQAQIMRDFQNADVDGDGVLD